jgi:hypothetical protein
METVSVWVPRKRRDRLQRRISKALLNLHRGLESLTVRVLVVFKDRNRIV